MKVHYFVRCNNEFHEVWELENGTYRIRVLGLGKLHNHFRDYVSEIIGKGWKEVNYRQFLSVKYARSTGTGVYEEGHYYEPCEMEGMI